MKKALVTAESNRTSETIVKNIRNYSIRSHTCIVCYNLSSDGDRERTMTHPKIQCTNPKILMRSLYVFWQGSKFVSCFKKNVTINPSLQNKLP